MSQKNDATRWIERSTGRTLSEDRPKCLADFGGHKIYLLTFRFPKLLFHADALMLCNSSLSLLLPHNLHALANVGTQIEIVFPAVVRALVQHAELVAGVRILGVEV